VEGVADRPLPHHVLQETTGLPDHQLGAALHELADHRLLADATGDDAQLRHPLLAAAVRRRLVPGEAHDEHRRLARALAGMAAPAPAEIAAHWQAAGESAEELPWRLAAAREADERRAGVQAAEHWTRVLELWPPGAEEVGTPPVDRAGAWFGAMHGHDLAGRVEQAASLTDRAMEEMASWPARRRADLLRRAGDFLDKRDHIGAGMPYFERAIEIYRELPLTLGLVRTLGHTAMDLVYLGRTDEASARLEEARAGLLELGLVGELRWLTTNLAWLDARMGDVDRALSRLKDVDETAPPDPDPIIELVIGVLRTDLLLMCCCSADDVAAVAEKYLRATSGQGIDAFERTVLVANVALARLRAGQVARASAVLATAARSGSPSPWLLRVLTASAEAAAGHRDEARDAFAELRSEEDGMLQFLAAEEAGWELWEGHPERALTILTTLFSRSWGPNIPGDTGAALALAARAAADLAASDPRHGSRAGRRALAARVETLRSAASFDPFAPDNAPADRLAACQWAAELERLAGSESVERWLAAAADWDTAGRPHDAAYCRWRGALVARRTGQAGVADRLLRRAARDAREHQPLLAAIRTSARRG
jgi:tetratricopeptide (TPR) repeat protein